MPGVVSVFGVEPFRIGGTETFARELSVQLAERGRQSVLCFLSEPPEQIRSFLELPNVSIEVFEDSTNSSWTAARKLAKILRHHRPEVLHLHFTGFLGIYPWIGQLLSTRKVFFTDHTSRPAGYVPHRAPFWKRILVPLINLPLTKVICVSDYGYRCMTSLGLLPTKRYELVYNGVDLSRVAPDPNRAAAFRRRYSIPDDRTVVVQVSWMIPEKGIPDLLQAAKHVLARNPSVQFVLVGEGAYRDQYMKDASDLGLGDHITWTGLAQDPFGEGVYDVADIVCQLSQWEEVFGWMIAEAMAYGKPVVATRVGGIPEVVNDQESGFLVDRGDTCSTAEKILTLAGDAALRAKMGEVGRTITKERFNLGANVARLVKSYDI